MNHFKSNHLPPFVKWIPLSIDRMHPFIKKVNINAIDFASLFLSWHRSCELSGNRNFTSYFSSPLEQIESFTRHSGARIWLADNLVWENEMNRTNLSATYYRLHLTLRAISLMTTTQCDCTDQMNETIAALYK